MLVRFNNLKILLNANEAKPGGLIGAMLSPYLYSNNMNDFCKKFNEQTKIYNNIVCLTVKLFCDISEKFYTFFLKGIPLIFYYHYQFSLKKRLSIIFLYDLILYISKLYKLNLYYSTFLCFSILRTYKKKRNAITTFKNALNLKLRKNFLS